MLMIDASLRSVNAHFIVSHNVIRRIQMRFNDDGSVQSNTQGGPLYYRSVSKESILYCKNIPNSVIECNRYRIHSNNKKKALCSKFKVQIF